MEGAASFADKMSKAPKPEAGKCSGPVKANESLLLIQFLRKPAEGWHVSPEDGSESIRLMKKVHWTGVRSSNKGEAPR